MNKKFKQSPARPHAAFLKTKINVIINKLLREIIYTRVPWSAENFIFPVMLRVSDVSKVHLIISSIEFYLKLPPLSIVTI